MSVAGWDGPEMRIVLLARGGGEWWQSLATSTEDRVARLLGAPPVTARAARVPRWPGQVFSEALTAFAGKLAVTRPAARLVWEGPEPVVLVVHAAALLAVLDYDGGRVVSGPRVRFWAGCWSTRHGIGHGRLRRGGLPWTQRSSGARSP